MTHPDPLLERAKTVIADLLVVVAGGSLAVADSVEVHEATDLLHDLREYLAGKRLAAQ